MDPLRPIQRCVPVALCIESENVITVDEIGASTCFMLSVSACSRVHICSHVAFVTMFLYFGIEAGIGHIKEHRR